MHLTCRLRLLLNICLSRPGNCPIYVFNLLKIGLILGLGNYFLNYLGYFDGPIYTEKRIR